MASIRSMRLGVIVSPAAGFSYEEICDLARTAETSGFASFWVSDHFFGGPRGMPDRNCLEAWTLLAALARDTQRIRLGVLVAAVQFRNPALATYHGKHYRIDDAVCAPKPLQRPRSPIWVGGEGPRVMRLAARYADGFDLGKHGPGGADLTNEEMAAAFKGLGSIEEAAKREKPLLRSHWSSSTLEGDGEALVEKVRGYAGAGLDQYLCAFPKDRAAEMIERSRERLIPAFA